MHRLIRIEGLHDFKVGNTLKFVLYNGSNYITLEGEIGENNYVLFENHEDDTSKLFAGFGITDVAAKIEYCKKQDPKCVNGIFPEHSSLEALKNTLLSFFDLNMDIKIPSIYKVGDKVRIKSKYDLNSISSDYPYGFIDGMLKEGIDGKICTISSIQTCKNLAIYTLKHYKEPYCYTLKGVGYNWSAAMFESKVDNEVQIKEIIQKDTSDFEVQLTNDKTIRLKVQGSGFLNGHNEVFRICNHKKQNLSGFLNQELDCVKNERSYEPYIDKKENIWIFIDDLKYRFGTEECKKTINPEFYKHLKEKPQQGIVEQIEYSQTKTQGNAHQFCKMRGTVCRGTVPEGSRICGKRSKASVSSRPLSYREIVGS